MLPAQVFSSLCEMTPEAAVDTLVKTAAMPGFLQELVSPTGTMGAAARNGLIGAGVGGLLGAVRETRKNEQDRNYGGGVTSGALLGGILGGAGTAAWREGGQWLKPTKEQAEIAKVQADSAAAAATAQHDSDVLNGLTSPTTPRPERVVPLTSRDWMPPALRLFFNSQGGGGVAAAHESLFPSAATPQAAENYRASVGGAGLVGLAGGELGRRIGGYVDGGHAPATAPASTPAGTPAGKPVKTRRLTPYHGIAGQSKTKILTTLLGTLLGAGAGPLVAQGLTHNFANPQLRARRVRP